MRKLLIPLMLAAMLALVPAARALSDTDKIVRDCNDDGRLQGRYTPAQLTAAYQALPSDVSEYTNCADLIRAALIRAGAPLPAGHGNLGSQGDRNVDSPSNTLPVVLGLVLAAVLAGAVALALAGKGPEPLRRLGQRLRGRSGP
jgi:hypothetical protein